MDYPVVEHHAPYSAKLNQDWKIGDYFGTIFVINLPAATDRLAAMQKSLEEIGVRHFEILPATNGRKEVDEQIWKKMDLNWQRIDLSTIEGRAAFDKQRQSEAGCYLSHLRIFKKMQKRYTEAQAALADARRSKNSKAIKKAKENLKKSSSVLILEDDNGFGIVKDPTHVTTKGVDKIFHRAMKELPKDWDMLYFMSQSLRPASHFSDHLAKLSYGIFLNAYAVNHRMYEALINRLERLFDPQVLHFGPVDAEIAELHAQHHCYAITPSIAYQRDGISSITSKTIPHCWQYQPITPRH